MNYLTAGNKSYKRAKEEYRAGNYNLAAQLFDHAYRMFQHHEWLTARSQTSPAMRISRRFLIASCRKRDELAA